MRVLICGLLKTPNGDAGALRQHKLAIMCRELGHEPLVVGLGMSNGMKHEGVDGITYVSLREGAGNVRDKVMSHLRYWKRLKKEMDTYQPDVIIMDDLGSAKTIKLKQYCKRNKIRLIHDSVEWYSPEQFKHGKFSMTYIRKDVLNRFLIDKSCGVIAISRYLEEYFKSKGCQCARIPIVITEADLCKEKEVPEDKIVFTYAGQPGKKDYLHVMLDAFALLPDNLLQQVVFNIVGCTREQMLDAGVSGEVLEKLSKQLVIHGRVSHEEVLHILKGTHFTLLMRSPVQRYAKAGFPTKVVESLSRSTPVICNLTSDLDLYLRNEVNALIVEECNPQNLYQQLAKAITMNREQRVTMCYNARELARKHFMYTIFLHSFQEMMLDKRCLRRVPQ